MVPSPGDAFLEAASSLCTSGPDTRFTNAVDTAPVNDVVAEVTLCLRPEFIKIARGEAKNARNIVNGRVDSLVFVGEAYEAEIRSGTELLLAKTHPDVPLTQGEAVSFSLDPEHCLLVAA